MRHAELVQQIIAFLEKDQLENSVTGCLRLATGLQDHLHAAIFFRELNHDKKALVSHFHETWKPLSQDAVAFIVKRSGEHWVKVRTSEQLRDDDPDEENRNVLCVTVGEISADLEQSQKSIDDLTIPPGMSPFDVAAAHDEAYKIKGGFRLRIRALQAIRERIKALCWAYVISVEHQLRIQERTETFVQQTQNRVHGYFRGRSESVLSKLEKASELAEATDAESQSLALAAVRRAVKAAADYWFPAIEGKTMCADGIERVLMDDQYLNRLAEFVANSVSKSSSSELLKAEMVYLVAVIRRLNDLASKGVHATTSCAEAKQGILTLYVFLSNLIGKLEETPKPSSTKDTAGKPA